MILIISYDLKSIRDYTPFYEAMKQQGPWWHYLASTWLISTSKSPQEIAESVHPFMDPQDFLLVTEMGDLYQGYLPKQAWDWISDQLKASRMGQTLAGLLTPGVPRLGSAIVPTNILGQPINPFIFQPPLGGIKKKL
jgi:hypothetical protein